MFFSVFGVAWCLSYGLSKLHALHPFPDPVYAVVIDTAK